MQEKEEKKERSHPMDFKKETAAPDNAPLATPWMVVSIVKGEKRTPWSVIALDEKLMVRCPAVCWENSISNGVI